MAYSVYLFVLFEISFSALACSTKASPTHQLAIKYPVVIRDINEIDMNRLKKSVAKPSTPELTKYRIHDMMTARMLST